MQNKVNYAEVKRGLEKVLGKSRVAVDSTNRLLYSRDMMSANVLDMKAGVPPHLPDLICWPESVAEISKILKLASQKKVPVIPYGGGSGVSGGTVPLRGGIMLDLKRMNRIEKIETAKEAVHGPYLLTAQTGILGQHLESQLNERGFTLGHFPSSIRCATLGGYLAARSAGQLSSKYGKIEDMVEAIEVVLPSGHIIPFGGPVPSYPAVRATDIFVGSEGCLGVITRAKLKVYPLPTAKRYRGISFNRLEDAHACMQEILQSGLRPAVMRLYDPLDTLLLQHGYKESEGRVGAQIKKLMGKIPIPREAIKNSLHNWIFQNPRWLQIIIEAAFNEVLLILGFEGEEGLTQAHQERVMTIAKKWISRDMGEKPGLHWEEHRYSVSYKMPQIFEQNNFVDTIEVATTWDKLRGLYQAVRKALTPRAFLLAHFSHAYPEGCSIYFTLLGRTGSAEKDRELYQEIWHSAMEACLKAGGTISHHHGIGLLKARYLPQELGKAMNFYRDIKHKLDPRGIMNPGKMGL